MSSVNLGMTTTREVILASSDSFMVNSIVRVGRRLGISVEILSQVLGISYLGGKRLGISNGFPIGLFVGIIVGEGLVRYPGIFKITWGTEWISNRGFDRNSDRVSYRVISWRKPWKITRNSCWRSGQRSFCS